MGKYFGTDGFRGEANVNLTVEHAFKVGRFLGWYFGQEHKAQIVIGKDTRRSSYMFEYSLVAGLTASGADVYLLHVTTPRWRCGRPARSPSEWHPACRSGCCRQWCP